MKSLEAAAIAAGAAYLVALGWAMQNLSYDIWGAFVVIPILTVISAPLITRAMSGELAVLRPWIWAGLFAKFAGAVIGYENSRPPYARQYRWTQHLSPPTIALAADNSAGGQLSPVMQLNLVSLRF